MEHHHHLVCSKCGRAVDFTNCDLSQLEQQLSEDTGFNIEGHILEVYGIIIETYSVWRGWHYMCDLGAAKEPASFLRPAKDFVVPFRKSPEEPFRTQCIEGRFRTLEEEFRDRLMP